MKVKNMLYILINYIFLMGLTIISIITRQPFLQYIKVIFFTALILNIFILLFYLIFINLKIEPQQPNFEVTLNADEQEIKDLLKEIDEIDESDKVEAEIQKDDDISGAEKFKVSDNVVTDYDISAEVEQIKEIQENSL